MDKKDEEEIKKWKSQRMNYVETYGIDIFNKKKKSKIILKLINIFSKITKAILTIIAILIVVFLAWLLVSKWAFIESTVHIKPAKAIKEMYNKKVIIVDKKLDENRNGMYILRVKENPDIQFIAMTEWTSMKNDYSDRCQKYYFEKWQSRYKRKIVTEETYENRILKYNQYIEISEYEQIEKAVKMIYPFMQFAGDFFFPDWEIGLKTPNGNIYPFNRLNMSLEDAISSAKNDYLQIQNKNPEEDNNNEDIWTSFFR